MSDDLKEAIRSSALTMGFDLCGVTGPGIESRYRSIYLDWLAKGYNGSMDYLARNVGKRLDPTKLVPGTKSIICLAVNYYQPAPPPDPGSARVAMYAWGKDYHQVVRDMLARLTQEIEVLVGSKLTFRAFVDTAPVMEKALSVQAGLGWIGSNSCLINRRLGSFLFLGELFVDIEIAPDEPVEDHCGRCRRCVEACPTGAIVEPGLIDAARCISYLTIEHSGPIDPELSEKIDGWIFGCDLCQQVCPFNRSPACTNVREFLDHRLGPRITPDEVLSWDEKTCQARLAESAANRADLEQWYRNARLVRSAITKRDRGQK